MSDGIRTPSIGDRWGLFVENPPAIFWEERIGTLTVRFGILCQKAVVFSLGARKKAIGRM